MLRDRSVTSFVSEVGLCHQMAIAGVVSHPGNYIDDREAGIAWNAENCTPVLERARREVWSYRGIGTAPGAGASRPR